MLTENTKPSFCFGLLECSHLHKVTKGSGDSIFSAIMLKIGYLNSLSNIQLQTGKILNLAEIQFPVPSWLLSSLPSGCMEDEGSVSVFKVDARLLSVVGKTGWQNWFPKLD